MTKRTGARTGGRILVDQLRIQGCDRIFTVPGESFLAVLDALHDTPEIDLTVCRQEGGVAYMADAVVGMTASRGLLDGSLLMQGPGAPDFGVTNWALNLPHIIISGIALVIGFSKPPRAASRTRGAIEVA